MRKGILRVIQSLKDHSLLVEACITMIQRLENTRNKQERLECSKWLYATLGSEILNFAKLSMQSMGEASKVFEKKTTELEMNINSFEFILDELDAYVKELYDAGSDSRH
jgi:hypothetical protein